MGLTICEKILARASGRPGVRPGEYVWARVDGTAIVGGAVAWALEEMGVERLFDPERIYVTEDHCAPAPSVAAANSSVAMRRLVERYGLPHFFEWGRHGIQHELFPRHGFVSPGDLIASLDSHSTSHGCFNAAACSIAEEEQPLVLASGQVWLRVPPTRRLWLAGTLPGADAFVVGKDVILHLAARLGTDFALYRAIEFAGPGVASISMAGRFTMANMSAELGAKFAVFPYDERTEESLDGRLRRPARPTSADPDAVYEATVTTDLAAIAPQVACPHDPGRSVAVDEVAPERVRIHQAFIGSCCNGRMEDFRMAARILGGRKVHQAVRLIATPASQAIWRQCLEEGIWRVFADADAVVTNSTCGACAGIHLGLLGDGEVCISSGNRNYAGRMGSSRSAVYLANAATVAAAAVTGTISDPREFL